MVDVVYDVLLVDEVVIERAAIDIAMLHDVAYRYFAQRSCLAQLFERHGYHLFRSTAGL
jgi:hypothetical protein